MYSLNRGQNEDNRKRKHLGATIGGLAGLNAGILFSKHYDPAKKEIERYHKQIQHLKSGIENKHKEIKTLQEEIGKLENTIGSLKNELTSTSKSVEDYLRKNNIPFTQKDLNELLTSHKQLTILLSNCIIYNQIKS